MLGAMDAENQQQIFQGKSRYGHSGKGDGGLRQPGLVRIDGELEGGPGYAPLHVHSDVAIMAGKDIVVESIRSGQ